MVSIEGKLTKISIIEGDDSEQEGEEEEERTTVQEIMGGNPIPRKDDLLGISSEKETRENMIEERLNFTDKKDTSIPGPAEKANETEKDSKQVIANSQKSIVEPTAESGRSEESDSLMDQMLKDCLKAKQQAKKVKEVKEMKEAKTASGMKTMKKGFLNKMQGKKTESEEGKSTMKQEGNQGKGNSGKIETLTLNKNASKDIRAKIVEEVGNISHGNSDSKTQENSEKKSENNGSFLSQISQNKDAWMTPELLQKIAANDVVKSGFADPECQQALSMLQVSPPQAMMHYRDNPKVTKFLIAISEILGKHFEKMGEEEEEKKKKEMERQFEKEMESKGPLMKKAFEKQFKKAFSSEKTKNAKNESTIKKNPIQSPLSLSLNSPSKEGPSNSKPKPKITEVTKEVLAEDEQQKQVNKILANDELKSILLDPEIQTILTNCSEPGKLQYYMRHEVYGPKIQKLLENGLVQIER